VRCPPDLRDVGGSGAIAASAQATCRNQVSDPNGNGNWVRFAKIIDGLFGLFRPMTFTKPYPWPPAILINEFDAGGLQCISNNFQSGSPRLSPGSFKLMYSDHADACLFRQLLLTPTE
jgi:hypothetical protein